eukprot:scaffold4425_cov168-Amphora_coffeaeformis.AAC.19
MPTDLLLRHSAAGTTPTSRQSTTTTALQVMRTSRSASSRSAGSDRSKRQERVGHVVRTELSKILHSGVIKGRDVEYLEDELRQRISIINTDVSPDLRQARVSISVSSLKQAGADGTVDKRRAYAWLVRNTKPLRHTLAQRLKHMKSCPQLTFVQVDVAAAVDVMYLIDQVSAGAKREMVDLEEAAALDIDDDEDWEEDEDFFK